MNTIWKSLELELPITLRGIYGRSSKDIIIVGNQGFAMHFDGENLTGIDTGSIATLYAIHGDGADQIIAVGDLGTVLNFTWVLDEPPASE